MKISRIIFYLLPVVGVTALSYSTRTYSAICMDCLRQARISDRLILGIPFSHVENHRPHPSSAYDPVSNVRVAAPLNPDLYQEITGHPCEHKFVRDGFLRIYGFRKELAENLYRCYLRVPDKTLARETMELIDQLDPPKHQSLEVGLLPGEPLGILYRGLALAESTDEWRQVLASARMGDASLNLLVDPALLARRLDSPDPVIRGQIINQLAALKNPDAWATIAGALKDPHVREIAARSIVYSGQVKYFDQVFEAEVEERTRTHVKEDDPVGYTPSIFDPLIDGYTPEEIRDLLAPGRPYLDRIAFAAIRRQHRFEFLDEVLAVLNERASPAAVRAIESLLQGPTPFETGMRFSDLPRLDPWEKLVATTTMKPVESLTNYTKHGQQSIHNRQKIVKLGLQRDPAKWDELRELYVLGLENSRVAIAQAMAAADRPRTLDFLLSQLDLDYSRKEQTVAAIAGLGAIADPSSLAPLLAFLKTGAGTSFENHLYYQPAIAYALHRCRGIHRWRLVKGSDGIYSILK